jgi:hypothetical protein
MTAPIRNVAVLGAGVMGAGIAAHLANAGLPVLLLDIVPPDGKSPRDAFAAGGLEKALKARPAAFFHPSRARLVSVGNLEDDLGKLAGCDLVIEAVLERLDVKRDLFARLEKVVGPETIVSSNTSRLRDRHVARTATASWLGTGSTCAPSASKAPSSSARERPPAPRRTSSKQWRARPSLPPGSDDGPERETTSTSTSGRSCCSSTRIFIRRPPRAPRPPRPTARPPPRSAPRP